MTQNHLKFGEKKEEEKEKLGEKRNGVGKIVNNRDICAWVVFK